MARWTCWYQIVARWQDRRRLAGAALAGAHFPRHGRERLGHHDHDPVARGHIGRRDEPEQRRTIVDLSSAVILAHGFAQMCVDPVFASVMTSELTSAVDSEVDRAHDGYGGRQPRAGYKYWAPLSSTVSSRIGATRRKSGITRLTTNSGSRLKNIPFCPRTPF